MTKFEKKVPLKCQAISSTKGKNRKSTYNCENSEKSLSELGVFYESALPHNDKIVCLCEKCHFKYGLGKYESKKFTVSRRFELQDDGTWNIIEDKNKTKKFEEQQQIVEKKFSKKFKKFAKYIPFSKKLLSCYYCTKDTATPFYVKMSLMGPLVYFINPIDLITDFLPLVGFTDDGTLLAGVMALLAKHVKEEHQIAADHYIENKKDPKCSCLSCKEK